MAADDEHPPAPASDRSLVRRLQAGDDDAATQLYVRYAQRLRALAQRQVGDDLAARVDADDIVQSVFRTFFRRAALGQYDVPEGDELWRLFLVIGLNKARAVGAHHRAAMRDVRASASGAAGDKALEGAAGRDEEALVLLRLTIAEVLAKLPASQRRMIELRIEGHEVADIARATGRSKRSVERVLQEFRKALYDQIQEA